MKTILIFLVLVVGSFNLNAQVDKPKHVQMQEFVANVLEENKDLRAVGLIKAYYESKDAFTNFQVKTKRGFAAAMTEEAKDKMFREEYAKSPEFLQIKSTMNDAKSNVDIYLKENYPAYANLSSNKNSRKGGNKRTYSGKDKDIQEYKMRGKKN